MTIHTEDSRVKIPAILHLMRLGNDYLSLKNAQWDVATDVFCVALQKINTGRYSKLAG
ncbi:MAG: hypothetical protein ACRCV6_04085 [Formosimonas sp.]